jgi:hypothetical protein
LAPLQYHKKSDGQQRRAEDLDHPEQYAMANVRSVPGDRGKPRWDVRPGVARALGCMSVMRVSQAVAYLVYIAAGHSCYESRKASALEFEYALGLYAVSLSPALTRIVISDEG